MTDYLFSYGTLQKDKVQLELFGRLLTGTSDILKGYQVTDIEITDETFLSKGEQKNQRIAVLSTDKNDMIEGTVFEVNAAELLHADKYEPADYIRMNVTLASGKKAWVYAAR